MAPIFKKSVFKWSINTPFPVNAVLFLLNFKNHNFDYNMGLSFNTVIKPMFPGGP